MLQFKDFQYDFEDLPFFARTTIKEKIELQKQLLKIMFMQGLTHATKASGLFADFYSREAIIDGAKERAYLAYEAITELRNLIHAKAGTEVDKGFAYIPIIDQTSAISILEALKSHFPDNSFELGTTELDGVAIPYVKIKIPEGSDELDVLSPILLEIGHHGALATKDTLLQIFISAPIQTMLNNFANDGRPNIRKLEAKFKQYLVQLFAEDAADIEAAAANVESSLRTWGYSNDPGQTLEKIHALLDAGISTEIIDPSVAFSDPKKFYFEYLKSLLDEILVKFNTVDPTIQGHITTALKRMLFKLEYASDAEDYNNFIIGVEFAMDEIMAILTLLKPYTEKDIYANISKAVEASTDLKPANVSIHGSGMHAVTSILSGAEEFFGREVKTGTVGIGTTENIFYEISRNLKSMRPTSKVSQDISASTDEILQVMVLSMNDNINTKKPGHGSTDLIPLIKRQFANRKAQGNQDKLVVVIDTTMNNLTDTDLELILAAFSKEIEEGKLAVFIAHSLNKFYSVGLDRSAAGLSAGFYNPDTFFGGKKQVPEFARSRMVGYAATDITPQTVAHIFKHGLSFVQDFTDRIRTAARFIHESASVKDLHTSSPVSVDKFQSEDIYKTSWGFFVVRLDDLIKWFPRQEHFIIRQFAILLSALQIPGRDGYGFSETTSTIVGNRGTNACFRISIGPNAKVETFKLISDYIRAINNAFPNTDEYRSMERRNQGYLTTEQTLDTFVEGKLRGITDEYVQRARQLVEQQRSAPKLKA